ncbi:type II CRISPR RNA-guided endonuclease Cas9 [Campylobacter lari]|uniref:type II CRISPR RNA-guided endonuclease Cas9 n=1 Tax=Campylobacter lari TaxID=201 RepID=UPI0021539102|nr:type II CRISPR RNA-guided endonuclease Cas9 [Campylobacter lari]MCR6548313.1 type II CRISPR RNA-guided endonuclease Cas9 [Campylobacter lari]
MMKILGFDIGINSIGWAFVENDELKDCGVRIFTEAENPSNKESLALPRRNARSSRRRLKRRKARLVAIKRILAKELKLNFKDYVAADGELPKAYEGKLTSIYELRYKALIQKLETKDLARVILHIAKHRGYMNKNEKKSNDAKKGKILSALKNNALKLENYQSVGEYFYKEFFQKYKENTKNFIKIRNTKDNYNNCVLSSDLEKELKLILEKQKEFGYNYSEDFINEILKVAFFQRPLKDFSHLVGACTFFEEEKRACKNSYSAWEFVALTKIINEIKSLEKISGEIVPTQTINEVLNLILDKGSITYKKFRSCINLHESISFKSLKYDKENAENAKLIDFRKLVEFKKALGEHSLSRQELDQISTHITLIKDNVKLKTVLEKYNLSNEQINNLLEIEFNDYINLSFKALGMILPLMREGKRYYEACEITNLKPKTVDEKEDFLPAFCDSIFAHELSNPVVNRAISEYRKVLNALLKKYGKVHKIHLELARDVGLSKKAREKIEDQQKNNKAINDWALKECENIGIKASAKNILKLKLWKEQKEICIYSGNKISIEHLKDEKALEVDHIYPYSRSFDDSFINKVLVFTKENQEKLNKTPFEAFGKNIEKWSKIQTLAQNLPYKKKNKILDENFKDKQQQDFISRNLNDTRYITTLIAKYTKEYLNFLPLSENENANLKSGEKGSKIHVQTISGMLTSVLRHTWGFDKKDRNNHLHHALDAIIVAYSTNSIIKAFSDFRKNQELLKARFYAKELTSDNYKHQVKFFEPFKGFREKILSKIDEIFVSKPPRKRVRRALHEDTFYSENKIIDKCSYNSKEGLQIALSCGRVRKIGTKYVKNDTMIRVDIFKKQNKFYAIPIYAMDFALGILPNKIVITGKDKNNNPKQWQTIDESYEFCFSLYKNDLILLQKKNMQEPEFAYYNSFDIDRSRIKIKKHDNKFENLTSNQKLLFTNKDKGKNRTGIQNLKIFEKYIVTPLGDKIKADFQPRENISLKTSKKHGL